MSKKLSKTQIKLNEVLAQAKDKFKSFENFEKSTVAKARKLMRIPTAEERRNMTNDRILTGLKKLGVATHSEIQELEGKVARLEKALQTQKKQVDQRK